MDGSIILGFQRQIFLTPTVRWFIETTAEWFNLFHSLPELYCDCNSDYLSCISLKTQDKCYIRLYNIRCFYCFITIVITRADDSKWHTFWSHLSSCTSNFLLSPQSMTVLDPQNKTKDDETNQTPCVKNTHVEAIK